MGIRNTNPVFSPKQSYSSGPLRQQGIHLMSAPLLPNQPSQPIPISLSVSPSPHSNKDTHASLQYKQITIHPPTLSSAHHCKSLHIPHVRRNQKPSTTYPSKRRCFSCTPSLDHFFSASALTGDALGKPHPLSPHLSMILSQAAECLAGQAFFRVCAGLAACFGGGMGGREGDRHN